MSEPWRNNRDRILAVSLELFNDLGSVTVSTKQIAEKTGISPGNFYYHFTGNLGSGRGKRSPHHGRQ